MEDSQARQMAQTALDKLYKSIEDLASSYPYEDDVDLALNFPRRDLPEEKVITQSEIDAAKEEFFSRGGTVKRS